MDSRAARHCGGPRQSHLQTRIGNQLENGKQQLAILLDCVSPSFESCPVNSCRSTPWVVFGGGGQGKPGTEKLQEARKTKEGRNWAAGNSKGLETNAFRPKGQSTVLPCRQPGRGADVEHFEKKAKSREVRLCKAPWGCMNQRGVGRPAMLKTLKVPPLFWLELVDLFIRPDLVPGPKGQL